MNIYFKLCLNAIQPRSRYRISQWEKKEEEEGLGQVSQISDNKMIK